MNIRIVSYMLIVLLTFPVIGGFIGHSLGETNKYIDVVEGFIKYYLNLAQEKGVELPDNYMEKVNKALAYVEMAKNESNQYKAYNLILKAMLEFSPVYIYIQSNIDMEYTIDKSLYIEVINSKREILIQLNKTLERFEETMVICFDVKIMGAGGDTIGKSIQREMCVQLDKESLMNRIREALNRLEELKRSLDSMSQDEIEEALSQINTIIGNVTVQINNGIGNKWRGLGMIQGISIASRKILETIVLSINRSIMLIEAGEYDDAVDILRGLENRLDSYIQILNKSVQYGERFQASDVIINNVKELIDVLLNVKNLVSSAMEALENDDPATALNNLEQALNILESFLQDYRNLIPIPGKIINIVVNASEMMRNRIKINIRKLIQADIRYIERMINSLERQVNQLVNRYEKGLITKNAFINMLNTIKAILFDLKHELTKSEVPSQDLIDRVDKLLNYIDDLLAKYS